jgi:adenosylhomocysteine nucleosidase
MSTDLPPEVAAAFASSGVRRLGAATGALWRRPANAKELWRLWEQASTAAERLGYFLEGVVPQLYQSLHN